MSLRGGLGNDRFAPLTTISSVLDAARLVDSSFLDNQQTIRSEREVGTSRLELVFRVLLLHELVAPKYLLCTYSLH